MSIFFILSLTLINSVSVQAARVALPLYTLNLGGGALTVGLLATSFSVLPMLLSVPTGRFVDRFGSRWLLVLGAVGGGAGMLLPVFSPTLPAVFAATALIGLAFGMYNVSLQNLVGQLSDADSRTQNFSNYSLMNSASNFIGPLIAGFSIDLAGYGATCVLIALMTLAPAFLLVFRGGTLPAGQRHARPAGGSVTDMLSDPGVRKVLVASSLLHTGQDLYRFYLPVYAHSIGLSASIIGVVLSINSSAAVLVRVLLKRMIVRFTMERVLAFAFLLSAASLTLIPLSQSTVVLAVVSFVFGFGMGAGQPIITMLMYSASPPGRSGEAMGLRMTVVYLTRLVGPAAFGVVGSAFGLASMFWGNALLLGVGGAMKYTGENRKRATPPSKP
jgi:predicted MFS family arabinose efflux permease